MTKQPRRLSHEKSDIGALLRTDVSYEEALAAINSRVVSATGASAGQSELERTAGAPCSVCAPHEAEETPIVATLCTKADGVVQTRWICPFCFGGCSPNSPNSESSLPYPLLRTLLSSVKWCFAFQLLDQVIACTVSLSSMSHLLRVLPYSLACMTRDAILLRTVFECRPSRVRLEAIWFPISCMSLMLSGCASNGSHTFSPRPLFVCLRLHASSGCLFGLITCGACTARSSNRIWGWLVTRCAWGFCFSGLPGCFFVSPSRSKAPAALW